MGGRLLSASAAVLLEGRILLVRRRDIGTWEMPGGFVEEGEAPWEAAVRECREESGVSVHPGPIAGVYHRPRQDLTVFVFRCSYVSGEPIATDEASEAHWFRLQSLPDPWSRSSMSASTTWGWAPRSPTEPRPAGATPTFAPATRAGD